MSEDDWFGQLKEMLASASDEAAQRFSAACCRRAWEYMDDPRHRAAVEAAERLAARDGTEEEFGRAMAAVIELWADLPPRGPEGNLPWQRWQTWHNLTGATRHLGSRRAAKYAAMYAARAAASRVGEYGSEAWRAAWSQEIAAQRESSVALVGSGELPLA